MQTQNSIPIDGVPDRIITQLRNRLAILEVADSGLSFAGLPVMTHGFFPGGNGLYCGGQAVRFPAGGTLVLGSNFGSVSGFIDGEKKLVVLDERSNSTWKPLLKDLRAAGVDPDECFFTNAWPFLHHGNSNLSGKITTWLRNLTLMESCLRFFEYTLTILEPRLIIALGTGPAAFLSHVWPEILGSWKKCSIAALDDFPAATVSFQDYSAVCVAITHPSMRNTRHRRPPCKDRSREVRLLTEARLTSEAIRRFDR